MIYTGRCVASALCFRCLVVLPLGLYGCAGDRVLCVCVWCVGVPSCWWLWLWYGLVCRAVPCLSGRVGGNLVVGGRSNRVCLSVCASVVCSVIFFKFLLRKILSSVQPNWGVIAQLRHKPCNLVSLQCRCIRCCCLPGI